MPWEIKTVKKVAPAALYRWL